MINKKSLTVDHSESIIELSNVSFSYGEEVVIKDISMNIHKGDYVGIVGPNGGGKSTLIKLMLGIIKPTSGKITLFNQDILRFNNWKKLSYVPQKVNHADPHFPMTVSEVVSLGRYSRLGIFRFPGKKDAEIVKKSLEEVDMWEFRNRLIGDLSGGQQQRVFIARALAGEPEVIFLDEPTVGVDIRTQKQFYELLYKLNRELNITLVLATHELDVVEKQTTEIAYINCNIIFHGFPKDFVKSKYFNKLTGRHDYV